MIKSQLLSLLRDSYNEIGSATTEGLLGITLDKRHTQD